MKENEIIIPMEENFEDDLHLIVLEILKEKLGINDEIPFQNTTNESK